MARRIAWRRPRTRSFGVAGTSEHEGGSGTSMLLVHGVGATWRAWGPILPSLERHHHVMAPTLLGHDGALPFGAGTAPSVDALVDGLEAELDARGLDRVHVVGNSLGGWIALELARRGRARSVVVFSPAGAWTSSMRIGLVALALDLGFRLAPLLAGRPNRLEAIVRSPRWRRALMGTQVAHPDRIDPAEIGEALRAVSRAPVVRTLLKSLVKEPMAPLPADPACPIRVVWPEHDRVIPFRHFGTPMLDRLPGAELVRMGGIGHVPMSDDPLGVTDRILEVTRRVDAQSETA